MKKKPRSKFDASRAIEIQFQRALMKIARASGAIVESHVEGSGIRAQQEMMKTLKAYSEALTPWAKNQAKKLLNQTQKRLDSDKAYKKAGNRISQLLSQEFVEREMDMIHQTLILEQVGLIKSIPLEAGERAILLVQEGFVGGRRANEIASELMKTTHVTESRAKLIARTETARTSTALNLVRATSVGSTQYKWVTSDDGAVRPAHRKMNGKVFSWDKPPTLSDGTTGHPGTFPNCRCYAEPILPDE